MTGGDAGTERGARSTRGVRVGAKGKPGAVVHQASLTKIFALEYDIIMGLRDPIETVRSWGWPKMRVLREHVGVHARRQPVRLRHHEAGIKRPGEVNNAAVGCARGRARSYPGRHHEAGFKLDACRALETGMGQTQIFAITVAETDKLPKNFLGAPPAAPAHG